MHTLLIFLLLTFLAFILACAWIVRKLYRVLGLKALADLLRGKTGSAQQQSESSGQHAAGSAQGTRRRTATATGEVIVDQRDPAQANQKIFGKDEGEYVDFQEC